MPLPAPLPAAITALRTISPVGSSLYIDAVNGLPDKDAAALAKTVSAVDAKAGYYGYGGFASYWLGPARAWMVYKLKADNYITANPPTYDPAPSPTELGKMVTEVSNLSTQQVLDYLADKLSGKHSIAALYGAQTDPNRVLAMNTWDPMLFTQPEAHNPAQFVYLVVGLRRETNISLLSAKPGRQDYVQKNMSQFITATGDYMSAQHYLSKPDILKTSLISSSVITETKTKTYGNMHFGFILRAPKETIAFADSRDLNMGFDKTTRPDMLADLDNQLSRIALISTSFIDGIASLYQMPLPARNTVITGTAVNGHNEVAVIGTIGKYEVGVAGIFVKTTPGKPMLAAEHDIDDEKWSISRELPKCADRLGVPLVRIPDPNLPAGKTWFHDRY
jgi:hypothetical protein